MAGNKKKKTKLRPLTPRPGARYTCFGDGLCCTDIHAIGPLTNVAMAIRLEPDFAGAVEQMVIMGGAVALFSDGDEIVPGITAVSTPGHTPGHMAYMIESGGQQLVLGADFANHYVWSLAYPDWEVKFDMDKPAAAATRKKVLGMLAADKIPFVGYHMPWPGTGFVEADGDRFRYVPTSYQLML